jgi:hypothetical protein
MEVYSHCNGGFMQKLSQYGEKLDYKGTREAMELLISGIKAVHSIIVL